MASSCVRYEASWLKGVGFHVCVMILRRVEITVEAVVRVFCFLLAGVWESAACTNLTWISSPLPLVAVR